MGKKRNNEIRRLKEAIRELEHSKDRNKRIIDSIECMLRGMLDTTHAQIASLQYVNNEQFREEMLQLTAIKRTLSIMLTTMEVFRRHEESREI